MTPFKYKNEKSDIVKDTPEEKQKILLDWYRTLYKADNMVNIKPCDSNHEMLISPLRAPTEYVEFEFKRNKLHWTVGVG